MCAELQRPSRTSKVLRIDWLYSVPSARTVFTLLLLYASKSGAVIVGIFVLPWYQRLLGPEVFGIVAAVLSLQAFLLMLDLGTSTLVGRDVAAHQDSKSNLLTWRAAEMLLHCAYAVLLLVALAANATLDTDVPAEHVVLPVLFFWALTVQNVGQAALLAKRMYALAAGVQVVGVLARASTTLAALSLYRADLHTFFIAQTITALAQMLITSWLCGRTMAPASSPTDFNTRLQAVKDIAVRGKPLVLFGLAGAAVLQLDKIIIPLFITPTALSPYFLASALCLTPISVLAGPITQFFQPRIIRSISTGDAAEAQANLNKLTLAIVCAVAVPSALLWLGRDFIIHMWLQQQPIAADVVRYVEILLPGVALGALGFVPYTILIAHQDYRAQANLSAILTVLTLLATAVSAAMDSIVAICWVYAFYHALSAVVSWLRSTRLQPPRPHQYATRSAVHAMVLITGITTIAAALTFLPNSFNP